MNIELTDLKINTLINDCRRMNLCKSRFIKADEELERFKRIKDNNKYNKDIIKYTNDFLDALGLQIINNNFYTVEEAKIKLKTLYKKKIISDNRNVVWMKFANNGMLGVIACSNDIGYGDYNTSSILTRFLGLEWDKSFVLIFPLIRKNNEIIGKQQRHAVETGIGNYLIDKGIPIIDFYSHKIHPSVKSLKTWKRT